MQRCPPALAVQRGCQPGWLARLPPPPHGGDVVLFVYINFAVKQRDIRGYIAMLMDMLKLDANTEVH